MDALADGTPKKPPASAGERMATNNNSKRATLTQLGMMPVAKRRRPSSSSDQRQQQGQQQSLQAHLFAACAQHGLPRIVSFGPGVKQEGPVIQRNHQHQLQHQRNTSSSTHRKTAETPKKNMKRSVSFNPSEKKHEFVVSSEERRNAWYARSDYRGFQEDAHVTALSVQLGISDLMHPTDFCLRGLEFSLSPREGNLRKLKRRLLIETIIEEQVSQKRINNGRVNSLVISELSKALSADALQDAVKRASQDASSNL